MTVAAVAPMDSALRAKRIRHPMSAHIPEELNVARAAKGFPWRPAGFRIILIMLKGEERKTELGIVLPDLTGKGKEKEISTGMCVAHGPGELVPHIGYVSPEHDYDCTVGDVVFIEPNTGQVVDHDGVEYRVITPHEIIMVGRRDVGQRQRQRLLEQLSEAEKAWKKDPANALHGTVRRAGKLPDRMPLEIGIGEAREQELRAKGRKTRTQIVVPSKG